MIKRVILVHGPPCSYAWSKILVKSWSSQRNTSFTQIIVYFVKGNAKKNKKKHNTYDTLPPFRHAGPLRTVHKYWNRTGNILQKYTNIPPEIHQHHQHHEQVITVGISSFLSLACINARVLNSRHSLLSLAWINTRALHRPQPAWSGQKEFLKPHGSVCGKSRIGSAGFQTLHD